MTLRYLALALALVLAVPAAARILRASPPRGQRLEAVWALAPVALLGALVGLAVAAGS